MAASFRSGIKILCESTKLQAWSSIRSRSVSDGPAVVTLKPTLLPFSADRKRHQFLDTHNTPATRENVSATNRYFSDSKYSNTPRCPVKPENSSGRICPPMPFPGCEPRAVQDCAVIYPRERFIKLEAPYPSYSECTRDATLMPRPTEIPRSFRSPQALDIKENLGMSIDGCNPPKPKSLLCLDTKKWAPIKSINASCDTPVGQCDPKHKPFKNANISSSSPIMRRPSASSVYVKVTEPMTGHKQFMSSTRLFSDKAKEAKDKCEKMPKKQVEKIDFSSPVSCSAQKGRQKGACAVSDTCVKVSTWRECPQPKPINTHRCPVKVKTMKRLKKKKVLKCKPTFKECPCPEEEHICPEPVVEVVAVEPRCCKVMKVLKECPCPPRKTRCDVKVVKADSDKKRCVCGPGVSRGSLDKKGKPGKKMNNAKKAGSKRPGGFAGSCPKK